MSGSTFAKGAGSSGASSGASSGGPTARFAASAATMTRSEEVASLQARVAAAKSNPGPQPASGSRSVASRVPRWQKNPYLYKMAEIYMHKIPMGVREMVVIAPLMLLMTFAVWKSDVILPIEGALIENPEPSNFKGYHLEPVYDAAGNITAYRRVNSKPE